MEYLLSGEEHSETLLFVHGLGANLSQFEQQHAHFSHVYKVLSVSLRGHGSSKLKEPFSHTNFALDTLAEDIIALLDKLGITRVHYIGNSMGGNVGFELLKAHAGRLQSFTTFGTTGKLKKPGFVLGLMKFVYRLMGMKRMAKLSATAGRSAYAKAKIAEMIAQTPKNTVLAMLPVLGCFDYLDVIKGSRVPAMLIKGEMDTEINQELDSSLKAFRERGNFTLKELKGTGHFTNLDHPELFNETLQHFLQEQSLHKQD